MELLVRPTAPFDLDLSAQIFSEGDGSLQRYEGGVYWQAVVLGERPALIRVRQLQTVDEPLLAVEALPEGACSSDLHRDDRRAVNALVTRLFNLDLSLEPFYLAVKDDRIMGPLSVRLKGLHSPSAATVFQALVESIVEQQISLHAARSIQRRIIEAFGQSMILQNKTYYAFPRPESLARASVDQLKDCGLSGRKAEYVRGISRQVAEGLDLEALQEHDDQSIIEELGRLRGVGVWTAEMTMVRGMQKFDAFPADDLGLRRVISHYYHADRAISASEARSTAEGWRGWRGLASFYLIVAERLGIDL